MTEIIDKELTPEEIAEREAYDAGAYDREVERVQMLRFLAYTHPQTGSDVLLAKYQLGEDGVTLDDVKARKAEIRAEYPMPEPPQGD